MANNPIFEKPLAEATVQDIQLELIRRTRFNTFDGERLVANLLAHRELWEAVLLDRISFSRTGQLPVMGLIKLRDLSDNIWNADTLYILCPSETMAKELAKLLDPDDSGGMTSIHADPKDVDSALGSGRETRAVVKIWWD